MKQGLERVRRWALKGEESARVRARSRAGNAGQVGARNFSNYGAKRARDPLRGNVESIRKGDGTSRRFKFPWTHRRGAGAEDAESVENYRKFRGGWPAPNRSLFLRSSPPPSALSRRRGRSPSQLLAEFLFRGCQPVT